MRLLSKISRAVCASRAPKQPYDFVLVVDHQGQLVHVDEVAHLVEVRHVFGRFAPLRLPPVKWISVLPSLWWNEYSAAASD